MDYVQVLRIVCIHGPRDAVERQVENSLQGTKRLPNGVVISAATLGDFPEILHNLPEVPANEPDNWQAKPYRHPGDTIRD